MQVEHANIYDYPKYYDLIYGSDWKPEYDFLLACFARYAQGRVQRVFEPACGTGRLLNPLAGAGYDVSGLDLNERAVDYCNRRLLRHGHPGRVWVGDMARFTLPRRVDAAFNMINSFRHLPDESTAEQHLRSMGRALRVGGIYVLALHLTPTRGKPMGVEEWSARRGHLGITARLWTRARNRRKRLERCAMVYDVYTPTRHQRLANEVCFRTYTGAQFQRLLDKLPEFEVAAVHDFAYDINYPIEIRAATEDAVFVMRKRRFAN